MPRAFGIRVRRIINDMMAARTRNAIDAAAREADTIWEDLTDAERRTMMNIYDGVSSAFKDRPAGPGPCVCGHPGHKRGAPCMLCGPESACYKLHQSAAIVWPLGSGQRE